MYYCQQDNPHSSVATTSSTSLSSTANNISASLNLLREYNQPVDFLHGSESHVDSDVQLSYLDRSIDEEYYDITDHDHSVQPVINQQSHHAIQPVINQQSHHAVQPVINQQSNLQTKDAASVVMLENALYHITVFTRRY